MYVVLAAAAAGAIAPTTGIGVRNLIGRNGHRIDAANQLGGLRLLVGSNERVLSRLRSLEFQGLVLSGQRGDLVLSQEVQNGPAVCVGVVDNVPRAVLDGIAGVASLGSHIIPNALNGSLNAVGLGCQVVVYAVNSPCVVAAALLELGAQIAHGGVHTVESIVDGVGQAVGTITDSVLDGIDAALEVVQSKALVNVGACGITLEARPVCSAKTSAEAIAPAAPKGSPNEEQNNPGRPVSTPHGAIATITAALISGSNRHCHNSAAVRRKTHDVISFVDLFSKPGRDFDQDKEM